MRFNHLRRREFITLLGSAAAAWPLTARAQQPASEIARVGILGPNRESRESPGTAAGYQIFLAELRKLGFTEGQNLVVEYRRTDEGLPQAFIAANELVAAKADVLFATGPELSLEAAAAARRAVPIVILANNYDPIAHGYVKRPRATGRQRDRHCLPPAGIGGEAARAAGGGVSRP